MTPFKRKYDVRTWQDDDGLWHASVSPTDPADPTNSGAAMLRVAQREIRLDKTARSPHRGCPPLRLVEVDGERGHFVEVGR